MRERQTPVLAISAATRQGTRELLYAVLRLLETTPLEPVVSVVKAEAVSPEDEDTFEVLREGQHFRVRGKRVERAAAMTDWESREAIERFQRILKVLGILEALQEAGVKRGDTVFFGTYELEWR